MRTPISVVIAAHNASGTIDAQLSSLLSQTWPDGGEVIVADNGSSDHTAEIAASFCGGPIPVRVVSCPEVAGAGYARNRGVDVANSDLIAFCDADDVVGSTWIVEMTTGLADARVVGGKLDFEKLNEPWVIGSRGRLLATDCLPIFDGTFPVVSSCNLGIQRDLFASLGGFNTDYRRGQDAELSLRIHRRGIASTFLPDAVVHYRMRSTLRAVFTQARQWGEVQVRLRAALGNASMAPRTTRSWLWLGSRTPLLATRAGRARWAYVAGMRIGVHRASRQVAHPKLRAVAT